MFATVQSIAPVHDMGLVRAGQLRPPMTDARSIVHV
jgi:hypothetical protein